ncbi:MAG TPA: PilZ domain-containing protein [Leptolinea sp.]
MTLPLKPVIERRQYYRLIYPPEIAPEVVILGTSFRVLDISEKGMRFRKDFSTRLDTGQSVQGVVTFPDSSKYEFKGYVLRVVNREAVVIFLKNLPYQKIMAEQLYLQRNT